MNRNWEIESTFENIKSGDCKSKYLQDQANNEAEFFSQNREQSD